MWEINNYNQIITFALSLCLGGIFCALYDVIRAVRRAGFNSFWAVTVTDILIWVIYAFTTFIFLIARTNGEIRGYTLIGEALGFSLFRISFSRVLFPVLSFIFINMAAIGRKTSGYISGFYIRFEALLLKLWKDSSKFFKRAKKLLKKVCLLLYTNKNIINTEKTSDETKTEA